MSADAGLVEAFERQLANEGRPTQVIQQWLGHRNIQHTLRYAELSPAVFEGLWEE